ncbi:hypothetical protein ACH5RR_023379 [Cinchona calisaya]|uniref:Uncharacterized protein n=1 Tax=Cinchona calisaya TaxID=153742 RepID=A0ABD2ZAH6_9GENT
MLVERESNLSLGLVGLQLRNAECNYRLLPCVVSIDAALKFFYYVHEGFQGPVISWADYITKGADGLEGLQFPVIGNSPTDGGSKQSLVDVVTSHEASIENVVSNRVPVKVDVPDASIVEQCTALENLLNGSSLLAKTIPNTSNLFDLLTGMDPDFGPKKKVKKGVEVSTGDTDANISDSP